MGAAFNKRFPVSFVSQTREEFCFQCGAFVVFRSVSLMSFYSLSFTLCDLPAGLFFVGCRQLFVFVDCWSTLVVGSFFSYISLIR